MAEHSFVPLRAGETALERESDFNFVPSANSSGRRSPHSLFSAASFGQLGRGGPVNRRASRTSQRSTGSDSPRRVSLLKLRESIMQGLSGMRASVPDYEDSFDEGDLLFDHAETTPHASADFVRRKKLLSQSMGCRFLVSFVVFMNTLVIAAEATFISYRWPMFDSLEIGFTLFYVSEIIFRLYEVGLIVYLTELDWAWNIFDLSITCLSVIDTVLNLLYGQTSRMSIGRLFRIFRILRMFRAMRFLNEVDYVLATAAKATLKLGVVVCLAIFVSAIIATNMLWDSRDSSIAEMFSSLGISMWSMFKLMTLDDWVPVSEKVIAEKPAMSIFFIVFIFCTSIALISLVPAIFIEISMNSKSREEQREEDKRKDLIKREKTQLLSFLFQVTDFEHNGKVSIRKMKTLLTDDNSLKLMREAGLTDSSEQLREIRLALFDSWEEEMEARNIRDSEVSEEDFVSGVMWSATDVSQASLWRAITATRLMVRDATIEIRKELKEIKDAQKAVAKLQGANDFDKLIVAIGDIMDTTRNDLSNMFGRCMQGVNQASQMEAAAEGRSNKTDPEGGLASGPIPIVPKQGGVPAQPEKASNTSRVGYGASMPSMNLSLAGRLANLLSPRTSPRGQNPDVTSHKNEEAAAISSAIAGPRSSPRSESPDVTSHKNEEHAAILESRKQQLSSPQRNQTATVEEVDLGKAPSLPICKRATDSSYTSGSTVNLKRVSIEPPLNDPPTCQLGLDFQNSAPLHRESRPSKPKLRMAI